MLVSDQLWAKATEINTEFTSWTTWLNKYGKNGMLIDLDDNTSFINPEKNQAIKLMYQPDSPFSFDYWEDTFGDEESGIIRTLNIIFNDVNSAQNELITLLNRWSAEYRQ